MTEAAPKDLAITCRGLHKSFRLGFTRTRLRRALQQVDLEVRTGTSLGFLGPNGAGKTTTIKILMNLIFPDGGEALVLGAPPSRFESRRRIGFLPENPSFPDHLTGAEVLDFAGHLLEMSAPLRCQRTGECLELVNLNHAKDLQVRRYSKGMVQRLGIAQALLNRPELLILDEPMSGLDPLGRRDIKDLLARLRREGRTIFFSTHIISDVEELCDRVAIIVGGQVTKEGSVQELVGSQAGEVEVIASHVPPTFPGAHHQGDAPMTFRTRDFAAGKDLIERLWAAGAQVRAMNVRRYRLEDVFMAEVNHRRSEPRTLPVESDS
jgi:ABC-2 type transport system ATP-binding protein